MANPRNQVTRLIVGLSAANFFAALGGGTVLSKCLEAVKDEPVKGASLLALVAGTSLGLPVLIAVKKWKGQHRAAVFALATGVLSLGLYALSRLSSNSGDSSHLTGPFAWAFLLILAFRWACFFVGRSLRAETAGFYVQRIPLVECMYFFGVMVGLVVWGRVLDVGLSTALLIDFAMQVAVAALDRFASGYVPADTTRQITPQSVADIPGEAFRARDYLQVVTAAIAMTVGVQMVLFAFAEDVAEGLPMFGRHFLAAFYAGAAAAAALCSLADVKFHRRRGPSLEFGWIEASIGRTWHVPLPVMTVGAAASTAVVVLYSSTLQNAIVVALVTFAAFCLGVTTLPLLNRTASLGKQGGRPGTVALAFGVMGLVATISLVCLSHWPDAKLSVVVSSLVIATLAISWPLHHRGEMRTANQVGT